MSSDSTEPRKHPSLLRAAAWVPDDDPQRTWEDAADLAAEWIWRRSEEEAVAPLVATNAQSVDTAVLEVGDSSRQWTTRELVKTVR